MKILVIVIHCWTIVFSIFFFFFDFISSLRYPSHNSSSCFATDIEQSSRILAHLKILSIVYAHFR